jgi:hypothetical protein
MRNLYDALRESHALQRRLCRQLVRPGRKAAARTALFTELRTELVAHAAAEERYLYAPLLLHDGGLQSSRHALHEHHQIDELLEQLAVHSKRGSGWMAKARALSHKVHHHLREEERKFFQVSGKMLGTAQKRRLLRQYDRDYARMKRKPPA